IAVAAEAGIPDDGIRQALASFSGVKRRFPLTRTWHGVFIFDDYGPPPAEIAAVLKAARAGARGRVIAVVEPPRYTRVRDLFQDFCTALQRSDSVIVTPLYSPGEAPIEGINHRALAEGIRRTGHDSVYPVDNDEGVVEVLRAITRPDDMVICLGAGNSTDLAHALPELLGGEPKRAGAAL